MNLYYAVGGGLGHFSRALAFVHTYPTLTPGNTVVMVADRDIYTLEHHRFSVPEWGNLCIEKIPKRLFQQRNQLTRWLQQWMDDHGPEAIFLDTFPAGISGEWNGVDTGRSRICYVGRYLDCQAYAYSPALSFDRAYRTEVWHPDQEAVISRCSRQIVPLALHYPAASVPPALLKRIRDWQQRGRAVWAVVHSEPPEETEALLGYARDKAALTQIDPVYLLCCRQPFTSEDEVHAVALFPAYGLFPHVDRIITAAGFNLIQQTHAYQDKHWCMPFPRRYDDQFLRFKKRKANQEK